MKKLLSLLAISALIVPAFACGPYSMEETEQFKALEKQLTAAHKKIEANQIDAMEQRQFKDSKAVTVKLGSDGSVKYFKIYGGERRIIRPPENNIQLSDLTAADLQKILPSTSNHLFIRFMADLDGDPKEIAAALQSIDQILPTTVVLYGTRKVTMFDIQQPNIAKR